MDARSNYLEAFVARRDELPGGGLPWLRQARKAAIDRFAREGFPGPKVEEWRHTRVAPITGLRFLPAVPGATLTVSPQPSQLVFVDGFFAAHLSSIPALPAGAWLGSLVEALESRPQLLEPHFARHASPEGHPFAALNTAFAGDGAVLLLPDDAELAEPLHLVFASSGRGEPTVVYPRVLVVTGRRCRATLVERHEGAPEALYFANAVTEIVVGQGSAVDHVKIEAESDLAFHVHRLFARQGSDSRFRAASVALGGAIVRHDVGVVLSGEGASCALDGLYLVGGKRHVDNHTSIDHAVPHCTSRQLYKGVVAESGRAVFDGLIVVRRGALKTDAEQVNRNLLLSRDAVVDAKPQLRIDADDVRCVHGATVGQLDKDAVFYLRARGIGEAEARGLLTKAFAGEVVGRVAAESVRADVERRAFSRLEAMLDRRAS